MDGAGLFIDLWEQVVAAVATGHSCRSAGKTFTVSVAKGSHRHRAIGSLRR
jgi:hypothetical protein